MNFIQIETKVCKTKKLLTATDNKRWARAHKYRINKILVKIQL